jgi:uncharacterized integral membrane protein
MPPVEGDEGTTPPIAAPHDELIIGRTRMSRAWAAVAVTLVLALLMLIFILQNGRQERMQFLWMHFSVPLGAALLLAAVGGGLLVVLLGIARLAQLRLAARRHRKAGRSLR